MTRARTRHLNSEVCLFLMLHTNINEDGMLLKSCDVLLLRNMGSAQFTSNELWCTQSTRATSSFYTPFTSSQPPLKPTSSSTPSLRSSNKRLHAQDWVHMTSTPTSHRNMYQHVKFRGACYTSLENLSSLLPNPTNGTSFGLPTEELWLIYWRLRRISEDAWEPQETSWKLNQLVFHFLKWWPAPIACCRSCFLL